MSVFLPAIQNHTSHIIKLVQLPPNIERPAFSQKKAFREWCKLETTDHAFVCMTTGENENLRVSKTNQARKVLGYCADYDCPGDLEAVAGDIKNLAVTKRPSYLQSTFSGGLRAFWLFEKAVPVAGNDHASEILKLVEAEVKANWLARGLDPNSTRPELTFEAGGRWMPFEGHRIPAALCEAWAIKIMEKRSFKGEGDSLDIPLESVRRGLAAKYGDHAWPGGWSSFELGARGNRFWDGGDSLSVIVKPEGLVSFTGGEAFMPWSKLLGVEWVRDEAGTTLAGRIADFYFDSANGRYLRKFASSGDWNFTQKDDVLMHLAKKGLSRTKDENELISAAEGALMLIQEQKNVDGVLETFFCNDEVVYSDGKKLLNVGRNKSPMAPAEVCGAWGEEFPWIGWYFDRMFGEDELGQKDLILRWLRHFYETALRGRVEYGLGLVLLGPSNTGKTFFSQTFLGTIFGACGNCEFYMLGQDQFTSELVRCPVWEMSDPNLKGAKEVARMGDFLKQVVANHRVKCRAMRQIGYDVDWHGRLVISLNDDPESLMSLPSFSNSAEDKLLALVLSPGEWRNVDDKQLVTEMPHFLAWLMAEPKYALESGFRFGMAAWMHPRAREIAAENSGTDSLVELLAGWAKSYFELSHVEGNDWYLDENSLLIGTSALWASLAEHQTLGVVFRATCSGPRVFGVSMSKICAKYPGYIEKGKRSMVGSRWVIKRALAVALEDVEQPF
jgi:hypothetical protein